MTMLPIDPAASTLSAQSVTQQPKLEPQSPSGTLARAIALDLRVRVRTIGPWPWVAYLGFGLLSRGQEPNILRTDSIFLFHQALWMATWALFIALLSTAFGKEARLRNSAGKAITLVTALATIQFLVTWILDELLPGPADHHALLHSVIGFLSPALPIALVCMRPIQDQSRPELFLRLSVILAGICLAAVCWRKTTPYLAGASMILTVVAAAVVYACSATDSSLTLDEHRPELQDTLDRSSSA
jgi:hypothetical protein